MASPYLQDRPGSAAKCHPKIGHTLFGDHRKTVRPAKVSMIVCLRRLETVDAFVAPKHLKIRAHKNRADNHEIMVVNLKNTP
jgi:hypothetical protein